MAYGIQPQIRGKIKSKVLLLPAIAPNAQNMNIWDEQKSFWILGRRDAISVGKSLLFSSKVRMHLLHLRQRNVRFKLEPSLFDTNKKCNDCVCVSTYIQKCRLVSSSWGKKWTYLANFGHIFRSFSFNLDIYSRPARVLNCIHNKLHHWKK